KSPEKEYDFCTHTNALTVDGQPWGFLVKKDVQMRAVDYIAKRARVFFVNFQRQEMTLKNFRNSEPRELRAQIFDLNPLLLRLDNLV
ncbi:MAG TPA: hypothetical protein VHL30_03310, partial [Chlamydiales bacterium]|nr:hypothetical protein [Chlamydiales bacterium]